MGYDGIEKRKMCSPCSEAPLLREMYGDIKALVSEFKNMNGALKDTKKRFDTHEAESVPVRRQVDENRLALVAIKEEKLNTTKASQWRIGLIAGLPGVILAILKVLEWAKEWISK